MKLKALIKKVKKEKNLKFKKTKIYRTHKNKEVTGWTKYKNSKVLYDDIIIDKENILFLQRIARDIFCVSQYDCFENFYTNYTWFSIEKEKLPLEIKKELVVRKLQDSK